MGINYMGGEAALPITPRRATLESVRPNNVDPMSDVSTGYHKCTIAWTQIDLS